MSEQDAREQLAREILSLVAEDTHGGGWWGHDTNCGDVLPDAIAAIKRYDSRTELVGCNTAGNPADAVFAAICQCGEPIVQDRAVAPWCADDLGRKG